jgi:hypothetical protein
MKVEISELQIGLNMGRNKNKDRRYETVVSVREIFAFGPEARKKNKDK